MKEVEADEMIDSEEDELKENSEIEEDSENEGIIRKKKKDKEEVEENMFKKQYVESEVGDKLKRSSKKSIENGT